jgi:hypothetical protein
MHEESQQFESARVMSVYQKVVYIPYHPQVQGLFGDFISS